MKLRDTVGVFIGLGSILLILSLFWSFNSFTVRSVQELEPKFALENAQKVDFMLRDRIKTLNRMISDWAIWDDTYNSVNGDYPEFVEENFIPETFENLGLNGIILVNESGDLSYEGYYDYNTMEVLNLSQESLEDLYSHMETGDEDSRSGLISVDGRIAFFSVKRVTDSVGARRSNSFIAFWRYFSEDDYDALRLGSPLGIDIESSSVWIKDQAHAKDLKLVGEGIYAEPPTGNSSVTLLQLTDLDGEPIGVMHLTEQRGEFANTEASLSTFLSIQTIFIIVIVVGVFFLADLRIGGKIKEMDSTIYGMIQTGDLSKKIDIKADDEIKSLASSFNHLIDMVNENRNVLIEKNLELSNKTSAIEATSIGIALLNAKGEYIYLNDAHVKVYGYTSSAELLGKTWKVLYYPDELSRFESKIMPLLFKMGNWRGEAIGRKKNGSIFPQEVSLTVLKDGGMICVVEDITERKEAERRLQAQKQELERQAVAMETSIVGIGVFNRKEEFIYVNKALARMHGYEDPKEIVGKSWRGLYPTEVITRREKEIRSTILKEGSYRGDILGKRADETLFPEDFTLTALKDGGAVMVVQDITERKEGEKKLQSQYEELSRQTAAMEASIVGTSILNKNGEFLYVNTAHAKVYGYKDASELIGKNWRILYDSDGVRLMELDILPTLNKKGYWKGELLGKKADGSTFPHELTLTSLKDGGWVRVVEDITERKEAERRLQAQKRELEKAYDELKKLDELKDNFLSNVTHELKTPLTSIQSYADILKDGMLGPVNDEQKDALSVIMTSSHDLNRLISDILDASKYESGNLVLSPSRVNLGELLESMKTEFAPQITKIRGRIVCDVDKSLFLFVDKEKMIQVFRNLFSNAIKYRSAQPLELVIKATNQGDDVVISVRDNGVGIEKSNIQKLFNRFYQVDQGLRRRVEGTGLGLSIVKSLIEMHKGRIEVASEFGKYTEFRIYLPANKK